MIRSPWRLELVRPVWTYILTSGHVPWLSDRKWAYIRLEGRGFGDVALNLELKLEVWDSPNFAGVIIDAVDPVPRSRFTKTRGEGSPCWQDRKSRVLWVRPDLADARRIRKRR